MGIFGRGEGYSREKYDEAAFDAMDIERYSKRPLDEGGPFWPEVMRSRAEKARRQVEKLYGQSHEEAKKLNEEYDRLWKDAQDALARLYKFEVKKLDSRILSRKRRLNDIDKVE